MTSTEQTEEELPERWRYNVENLRMENLVDVRNENDVLIGQAWVALVPDDIKYYTTQALHSQREATLQAVAERVRGMKTELPTRIIGDPNYVCYRLSGHEYDERGYCTVCFNPSHYAYERELHSPDKIQNETIDDVLKVLEELTTKVSTQE